MRELTQSFFDELDERPTRRAGGFVISVREATGRPPACAEQPAVAAEYRSGLSRFPRLERRQNYLAILTYMLENERPDQ
jgi:hypothetical protein